MFQKKVKVRKAGFWITVLSVWMAVLSVQASRVDTVWVKSPSMNRDVQVVYIVPQQACAGQPEACPVIYLLHGYGNNAKSWLKYKPELLRIADEKGIMFVCPDGKDSWYWNSPLNPDYRFEEFVSKELVQYTDSHYATVASRNGRAITGNSMGGHGALWNAMRHKDVFGAAGSTSGGVDIRPFPGNWGISRQLGAYADNRQRWEEHTVISQTGRIKDGDLALIVDCGSGDFFLKVNLELHRLLQDCGVGHDFIVRPGEHNWTYWINSIDYQILFFEKYFKRRMSGVNAKQTK